MPAFTISAAQVCPRELSCDALVAPTHQRLSMLW
jgi:hypothetical protein